MGRLVQVAPQPDDMTSQVTELTELEKRHAALRQAASLPAADLGALLDAAFTELEGAIGLLAAPEGSPGLADAGSPGDADGAERRLLRAAFNDVPVPLFLLARDGAVLRVNKAAGELLGSRPGDAAGRPFTAFVALPGRATVQTQLNAVARSGRVGRVRCGLLGPSGTVLRELAVGLVRVSGEADRLVVAVSGNASDAAGAIGPPDAAGAAGAALGHAAGAVEAITQRMDLVTAVTRLLLENENFSESMTLQRSARLLAGELAAWVIVDLDRRGLLSRQVVIGPDGPGLSVISDSAASVNPTPGSLPQLVHESGQPVLIAHAEDAGILGPGPGDMPLLMLLGTTSVMSVPITGGELAAAYLAATEGIEIGADFYDAYRTPAGWGLSVGDVCGKGEEAAAVTAAARHAIRVIAHGTADPAAVLSGANEVLLADELSGGFVTASIAHLGWLKGGLHAVLGSAGDPSAAIIHPDGRVQLPGGGGLPLGLDCDPEPGVHEVTMLKGDILFL